MTAARHSSRDDSLDQRPRAISRRRIGCQFVDQRDECLPQRPAAGALPGRIVQLQTFSEVVRAACIENRPRGNEIARGR